MHEIQLIYLIIKYGDLYPMYENELLPEYFVIHRDIIDFIIEFNDNHEKIPTLETVASTFPETEWAEEDEDTGYLAKQIKENYIFNKTITIVNENEPLLKENSFEGVTKIQSLLSDLLTINDTVYSSLTDRKEEEAKKYFKYLPTGIEPLDKKIRGFKEADELVVIMGRTGAGKSWFCLKLLMEFWKSGVRVGLYSGEMGEKELWYRFDTLNLNLSNSMLKTGFYENNESYVNYREEMRNGENQVRLLTSSGLKRKADVKDLENMILKFKLQILFVDQLSLLVDYKKQRGDTKRISYDNITMDLFNLANKLGVIIVLLAQVNREGEKATKLTLNHIAESDNVAQNSTKVIALSRDENDLLLLSVIKNRDGVPLEPIKFAWDIDRGIFEPIESDSVDILEGSDDVFIP